MNRLTGWMAVGLITVALAPQAQGQALLGFEADGAAAAQRQLEASTLR